MSVREARWRIGAVSGALVGYGCLSGFVALVGYQVYRWFREGEWTHIGVGDALRSALAHLGVTEGASGRLSAMLHWLDAPVDWLGLHRVVEVLPASLALFALSILGNAVFVYSSDRLRESHGLPESQGAG